MDTYRDTLEPLNSDLSLNEKLINIHTTIQSQLPFVARIAIALYDPKTKHLKTFIHSSGDQNPLPNYETELSNAPSLAHILKEKRPRVINNMLTFEQSEHVHSQRLGRAGYAASYTMPMFNNGVFIGFLFFNSFEVDVFSESALNQLDVFGHLISLMVINELSSIRTLAAAITTSSNFTHFRDPETGSHLDRMSRYARLIARQLAPKHGLTDDFIEHVFMYSPLHDIGKIGIPDRILLKPNSLDEEESKIMRTHTTMGREIIDEMLKNFGLNNISNVDILRNIAEYHHEKMNGKGYPDGLQGDAVPLEARIVATADIFDALTSRRPYKDAWSNQEALEYMQTLAGEELDQDCVAALNRCLKEVEEIQAQFHEDWCG